MWLFRTVRERRVVHNCLANHATSLYPSPLFFYGPKKNVDVLKRKKRLLVRWINGIASCRCQGKRGSVGERGPFYLIFFFFFWTKKSEKLKDELCLACIHTSFNFKERLGIVGWGGVGWGCIY